MATFTTRLGLRKPDPTPVTGDTWSTANDLNANWDKIDAALPPLICTSTTRPSTGLFLGMMIYETDTTRVRILRGISPATWRDVSTIPRVVSAFTEIPSPIFGDVVWHQPSANLYFFDGTNWKIQYAPARKKFKVAPGGNFTGTTTEQIVDWGTFTAVNGAEYELIWTVRFTIASGTPTAWTIRPRVQSGATLTTGGTLINGTEYIGPPPSGAWQTATYMASWTSNIDGQVSMGVGALCNGGATITLAGAGRTMTVKDIT